MSFVRPFALASVIAAVSFAVPPPEARAFSQKTPATPVGHEHLTALGAAASGLSQAPRKAARSASRKAAATRRARRTAPTA